MRFPGGFSGPINSVRLLGKVAPRRCSVAHGPFCAATRSHEKLSCPLRGKRPRRRFIDGLVEAQTGFAAPSGPVRLFGVSQRTTEASPSVEVQSSSTLSKNE